MSRIRLPRDRGHSRGKMREPFDVKLVAKIRINRRGDYRQKKRAIEKGQLKFQSMQINILKVLRQFASLVVLHQKKIKSAARIIGAQLIEFCAYSQLDHVSERPDNLRFEKFGRNMSLLSLQIFVDRVISPPRSHQLHDLFAEVHVTQKDATTFP